MPYYAGDQIVQLLSRTFDDLEVARVDDDLRLWLESIFGGRLVYSASPEVRYIASLLYILLSSTSSGSTLGQSLCGLSMFESKSRASKKPLSSRPLTANTSLNLAILFGLARYLETRSATFASQIQHALTVLVSPENVEDEERNLGNRPSTELERVSRMPSDRLLHMRRHLIPLLASTELLSAITSLASLLHDLLFFASAVRSSPIQISPGFPSLATRLLGVVHLSTTPTQPQVVHSTKNSL